MTVQNMVIPAHSSSVPVSAVGAAAAQQSLILPSVQHDSEATVGEKRPAPDSAQELPGPSVGVLPLHVIEEHLSVIHTSHIPLVCVPCEPYGSAWKRRGNRSNGRAVCITPVFLMGTHD